MTASDLDRRIRVQYPNAIYHVTSRGVLGSDLFITEADRLAFFDRCGETVRRFGWLIYAVIQMTTHFHLEFKTPEPNLSRGAQFLLGPYAQGFNRRHDRTGHVFEARYRCHPVESGCYFWTLNRYVNLNASPAIVAHPFHWRWSSFPGFIDPSRRLPWVCYDELLAAWHADFGSGPQEYCKFILQGLEAPPKLELVDGWVLGSPGFAERMRQLASPDSNEPVARRARSTPLLSLDEVVQAVCQELAVSPEELAMRSSQHPARSILAAVARHHSTATWEEIARQLGLSGRDSVHKKAQRAAAGGDAEIRRLIERVEGRLKS